MWKCYNCNKDFTTEQELNIHRINWKPKDKIDEYKWKGEKRMNYLEWLIKMEYYEEYNQIIKNLKK